MNDKTSIIIALVLGGVLILIFFGMALAMQQQDHRHEIEILGLKQQEVSVVVAEVHEYSYPGNVVSALRIENEQGRVIYEVRG